MNSLDEENLNDLVKTSDLVNLFVSVEVPTTSGSSGGLISPTQLPRFKCIISFNLFC